MRYFILLSTFLFVFSNAYARDKIDHSNCRLIEKKLDLINSQLEVVMEKYKIYFKTKLLPEMKAKGANKVQIKIGANNPYVKAMSNLSVASATYEALKEACYNNDFKAVKAPESEYKAKLIPTPDKN